MNLKYFFTALPLFLSACVSTNISGGALTYDRAHFVDLKTILPSAQFELRYMTEHNFIGRPVEGYKKPICLVTRETAFALLAVEKELDKDHLTLHIYDCYRPQKAVNDFVAWSKGLGKKSLTEDAAKKEFYPDVDRSKVFELGYVATQSGHTRGSTIDLTMAPADKLEASLDMGTPYDYFSDKSATASPAITGAARVNRDRLKAVMESHGFKNYEKEWWHYTLKDEPYPSTYFDFNIE